MESPKSTEKQTSLYDPTLEHSCCGVGFITRKDGSQTKEIIAKGHEALCAVPHRGGMSSSGVGDGAGICIDLSHTFFSYLTGQTLIAGRYAVGNFFLPLDEQIRKEASEVLSKVFQEAKLEILLIREIPVDEQVIEPRGRTLQLPIFQWVVSPIDHKNSKESLETLLHRVLVKIERLAYRNSVFEGFYPLSLSSQTQVLKGRLNSWEIVPYFKDLASPDHLIHTLFFHTRFSTNTDPHPSMAQPFRLIAHNGELNTDKKNRLSESAEARARHDEIFRPKGQSDSGRLDQTIGYRVHQGGLDLVTAVVSMMPPAWENDKQLPGDVRDMLEYFSLYEEKNDGPAALIFGDGKVVGARLDRLGLRPLRSVETNKYLAVTSEAGQINFASHEIISRGRIEAGGMLYYDHETKKTYNTAAALKKLAIKRDYTAELNRSRVHVSDLAQNYCPKDTNPDSPPEGLSRAAKYVAYSHNQESFKFLLDPMLQTGSEKVSAMGYGNAINALSDNEGGVAKYFSQRFAQVTNPPLDSIREMEGMTLRVLLGKKPLLGPTGSQQIVIDSPILDKSTLETIHFQKRTACKTFELLFDVDTNDRENNQKNLLEALDTLAADVSTFAEASGGIAILSDAGISREKAALPTTIAVAAVNQRLIEDGLRLNVSIIIDSGQIKSSHHIACALGFGASAIFAAAVQARAEEIAPKDPTAAYKRFSKAAEKSLLKTMGKVGLCTIESYSGGEFFEPNFLDTNEPILAKYFPNMRSPVGGVRFETIAASAADWHARALTVREINDIPILGLFKERTEGAGHSFGTRAVREFVNLTEEALERDADGEENENEMDYLRLLTLSHMKDALGITESGYSNTSFDYFSEEQINSFQITSGYRSFSEAMTEERAKRPAALRDILAFPADISSMTKAEDFQKELKRFNLVGNASFLVRGLKVDHVENGDFIIHLDGSSTTKETGRLKEFGQALSDLFGKDILDQQLVEDGLRLKVHREALDYMKRLRRAPTSIDLSKVQPASEITPKLASGAMSHGALVASAHEAVAHGTNMVGGMSNCGEGGEHMSRYGTIRASRIKQFASGRFGVWAGYLADPCLKEIEIKIGQGAKPGEGGQLPAAKVNVEIAAARGGTPGVELVSPPPHHDTYSIEDLGQLIHDAKASRAKVVVKLVSSEGIGTIAVGVAKAGADVINVAGSTGGTGAASVTSLKYAGRAAELGISEVHQALCANGIRQKVSLRCSGAMQTGSDVVKACLLGGDSFEFGTTALMMLKCVMAKNCNIKCPAGLTTNEEAFNGDPRALAQYLLNIAHEVRETLADIGMRSLDEARGRADLLHLLDHPSSIGRLDVTAMLFDAEEIRVRNPKYLECDYQLDEKIFTEVQNQFKSNFLGPYRSGIIDLTNRQKSFGGRLAVDLERWLNHAQDGLNVRKALKDERGRNYLPAASIQIQTQNSAGQSYGAFCNDGMRLHHFGTCNDGVGKGACGGEIVVQASEVETDPDLVDNVLIGNFALFGATGGRLFVRGQAGDRFAVRNSGATAVVEGVGDFCCEYMTNGTVLNLGCFSKGFGNGMSGGFAFQYDPDRRFPAAVSDKSVLIGSIKAGDEMGAVYRSAVKLLLEWHLEATSSPLAFSILANWENELDNFYWIMPKSFLQYQDADEILASKSRKEIIEELSKALARAQILRLKKAWKKSEPVLSGFSPSDEEQDSTRMFELVNSWTVLDMAKEIVEKRTSFKTESGDEAAVRNLVVVEDFELESRLAKHAKAALAGYSDIELSSLVAHKRLADFKEALAKRNVRSMDGLATFGWIICQDKKNSERLGGIPCFESLFAGQIVPDRLQFPKVS